MRRALWIALMIAGVGTAWWIVASEDDGRRVPVAAQNPSFTEDSTAPSTRPLATSRALEQVRVETPAKTTPHVTIHVRTEGGKPVAGAIAYWMTPGEGSREVPASERWATDHDGTSVVPWLDQPRYLTIHHPDFQPASVEAPEPDSDQEIVLTPGSTLEVTFLTRTGVPVANVELRCARGKARLGRGVAADPALLLPAGHDADAVRVAHSDGNGRARITGVEPGKWHAAVAHRSFIPVEDWSFEPLTVTAGTPREVRLLRMFAAVANIDCGRADPISVASRFGTADTSRESMPGSVTAATTRFDAIFRERFHPQVCASRVLPAEVEDDPRSWPRQTVVLQFAEFATQEVQVPIHPVDEITAPDWVRLTLADLKPVPAGDLRATVTGPRGETLPIPRLLARRLNGQLSLEIRIMTGRDVRLAAGRYSVGPTVDLDARKLLAPVEVDVVAGSETTVALQFRQPMAQVRFIWESPVTKPDTDATLVLECGADDFEIRTHLPHVSWIPTGRWNVSVKVGGVDVSETKVLVDASPADAPPLDIPLAFESK